jgi:hypothetical protein
MRLEDSSIDDLHQLVPAAAEDDPETQVVLNAVYTSLRLAYIVPLCEVREQSSEDDA